MEEIKYGLKGIGEKDTDYIMGADVALELLSQNESLGQPKYEYNQAAQHETAYYCTIYSCITELSYLLNKEFLLSDIEAIANAMIRDGKLDPNNGAYLSDAVDYTRKWYNANHTDKIASYQIDYTDKALMDILTNKIVRLTQIGYKTSTELFIETEDKGYASKKDYPKNGGHAVSNFGLNIIDNYKGKRVHNRYSFEFFDDLVKNGVIFQKGYLFLKA